MRWYKHQTRSHNDEKLEEIMHQFGLEGYGFWWLLLELVGAEMDTSDKCELSYPLKAWARKLHCTPRKTTMFFSVFSEKTLILMEYDNINFIGKLKIKIPNLLKFRDEYSKKSGVTPDKPGKKSGAKIEIEIEKEIEKESKIIPSSGDEAQGDFYLSKKGRKLTGKRLESFELFWKTFDYKTGKAEAADSWLDIPTLSGQILARIIEAAKSEASGRLELRSQGRTPKMAQGWLSSRRWEDEIGLLPVKAQTFEDLKIEKNKEAARDFVKEMVIYDRDRGSAAVCGGDGGGRGGVLSASPEAITVDLLPEAGSLEH
jgi:hypothetical protein